MHQSTFDFSFFPKCSFKKNKKNIHYANVHSGEAIDDHWESLEMNGECLLYILEVMKEEKDLLSRTFYYEILKDNTYETLN